MSAMPHDPGAFTGGHRAGLALAHDLKTNAIVPAKVISTGLWGIDHATNGGLRTGEVSIIAASTGHGKSAFGEQFALHASKYVETTYFALEMGTRKTERRMLAKIMGTDEQSVVSLIEKRPDHPTLHAALDCLSFDRKKLIVEERCDESAFTTDDMFRMMIANRSELYIIDHPRHLDDWHGGTTGNREQAAALIIRRICTAAKMLRAHIMIVSQLKTTLQKSRPIMQDIADTYAAAQSADTVMLLHRPYRGMGHMDTVTEFIVDKNRSGPEGVVHARWHGPHMKYRDMMPAEEAALECCKKTRKKKAHDDDEAPLKHWEDA